MITLKPQMSNTCLILKLYGIELILTEKMISKIILALTLTAPLRNSEFVHNRKFVNYLWTSVNVTMSCTVELPMGFTSANLA
jgi:replication initiation and membrane attachment protein DnaB